MSGNSKLVYNVSNNGANGGWYWEVITPEREIWLEEWPRPANKPCRCVAGRRGLRTA